MEKDQWIDLFPSRAQGTSTTENERLGRATDYDEEVFILMDRYRLAHKAVTALQLSYTRKILTNCQFRKPLGGNLNMREICVVDPGAQIHGVETPGFSGALKCCSTFAECQIGSLDQSKSTTNLPWEPSSLLSIPVLWMSSNY